jgi:hypothetical protein
MAKRFKASDFKLVARAFWLTGATGVSFNGHKSMSDDDLRRLIAGVTPGSWVASFGEMMESVKLSRAIGYCVEVQVMPPRRWGKAKRFVAPCAGWERAGHKAPFITHSCCEEHVNCEYVSTDEDEKGVCSVNVRTIRDIQSRGPDGHC